jgi:hypothetical protein
MIEGIEKAFVVIDIFLGALNEASLLIAQAEDQMNPAHSVWDRPGCLASSPQPILNQAAERVLHPSERRKQKGERFSNGPKSQDELEWQASRRGGRRHFQVAVEWP